MSSLLDIVEDMISDSDKWVLYVGGYSVVELGYTLTYLRDKYNARVSLPSTLLRERAYDFWRLVRESNNDSNIVFTVYCNKLYYHKKGV